MLVIEIDGYTHSFKETVERDRKKVKRLNELGITVLRFSDEDVLNNIEGVLSWIGNFIKEYEKRHTP